MHDTTNLTKKEKKEVPFEERKNEYINGFIKEKYYKPSILFPIEDKEIIKKAAEKAGYSSIGAFVRETVMDRIKKEDLY